MRNLVLCTVGLLAIGGATTAATAKQVADASNGKATCDAKYYSDLVGRGVDAAREISGVNYRVLPDGSPAGAAQPKRMTIKVDSKNRITDVSCG